MKKTTIFTICYFTCVIALMTSCSEDYPGPDPVEVTANYSNKFSNPNPNLSLTYSGEEMTGKSVDFSTVKGETANITLYNIIPGEEKSKIIDIPLSGDKVGYSFSGNTTGESGTTFKYAGRVEAGKLTLEISNVQLPTNAITTQKMWYSVPFTAKESSGMEEPGGIEYTNTTYGIHFNSDNETVSQIAVMAEMIGGNILGSVLRNINFNPDGNITARYGAMPQVESFIDYFEPLPIRPESDYTLSPLNLANYYVKGNSLYVIPNIDMIIKQIQSSKTRALSVTDIQEILQLIQKWTTTGIRFNIISEIKPEKLAEYFYIKHTGDMILHIDKNEIGVLLKLLPMLKNVIPDSDMKAFLVELLDMLIPELMAAEVLEIGIVLQKEYPAEILTELSSDASKRTFNGKMYTKNIELLNNILKK